MNRFTKWVSTALRRSSFPNIVNVPPSLLTGGTRRSDVDRAKALTVPAVFACVRVLSEAIANLPIDCEKDGSSIPMCDWLYEPSDGETNIDLVSQMVVSLALEGNAFLLTTRNDQGKVVSVHCLDPNECFVKITPKGEKVLKISSARFDEPYWLHAPEFSHVSWVRLPGSVRGISPIQATAPAINLAASAQEHATNNMVEGAIPAAVVEHPMEMSDEEISQWENFFSKQHKGSANSGKIASLYAGQKLTPISFSDRDAQIIESRQMSIADIARIFGVPPHMIGDSTGSTSWGSGLTQQTTSFNHFTLRGFVTRIDRCFTDLAKEDGNVVIKLNDNHLLHGDFETKVKAFSELVENEIISADEARPFIGFSPGAPKKETEA